jgi:hypothetical protein
MGQNSDHVLTQIINSFKLLFSHSFLTINVTPILAPARPLIDFMATVHDSEPATAAAMQPCNPQVNKILPNTLYLTFNAPRVDDYVRCFRLSLHFTYHQLTINNSIVLSFSPIHRSSTSPALPSVARFSMQPTVMQSGFSNGDQSKTSLPLRLSSSSTKSRPSTQTNTNSTNSSTRSTEFSRAFHWAKKHERGNLVRKHAVTRYSGTMTASSGLVMR